MGRDEKFEKDLWERFLRDEYARRASELDRGFWERLWSEGAPKTEPEGYYRVPKTDWQATPDDPQPINYGFYEQPAPQPRPKPHFNPTGDGLEIAVGLLQGAYITAQNEFAPQPRAEHVVIVLRRWASRRGQTHTVVLNKMANSLEWWYTEGSGKGR